LKVYRHSLSILARGAKREVTATSVPIHRPQKNHPHSQCRHDDHDSGDRHHTLRLRHVLGTKDRHKAPHRDSAECAEDEEGEEHTERKLHRGHPYGKDGLNGDRAPAGIALAAGKAREPT